VLQCPHYATVQSRDGRVTLPCANANTKILCVTHRLGLPPTPEAMAGWPLSQRLQSFAAYSAEGDDGSGAGIATSAAASRLHDIAASVEQVAPPGSPGMAAADAARDELGEALDAKSGSTVRDHAIFNEHARRYEREFMEDMEMLGVRPPDLLTRVTEYIDEIKSFVQTIVDRGLAYVAAGEDYSAVPPPTHPYFVCIAATPSRRPL
jgi:hypothetical protein